MFPQRTRTSTSAHRTASPRRRRLWIVALACVLVGALAAGVVGYLRWSTPPTAVALINTDDGPLGARIATSLQDGGAYDWEVVDEASTADYAVVVTLPTDLTTSVASLVTDKPQRAQVTATTHRNADPDLVNDATNEVTRQISAAGMDALFASMTAARGQLSQVAFTASLLGAGVGAAADAAGQFSGGADQMLGFLETAKSGASQLTSAIAVLNSTVSAATTQANQLADALDTTGVTVGQVQNTATSLSSGLASIVPLLQGLPFAGDPQLANIITQLQGLRTIADQAGGQLSGFGEIVGTTVTPDTRIGTLLRDAATRLGDASAQLGQGAQLAAQIPQIADQGAAQLLAAMDALTSGVSQLQAVTTTLNTQANQALTALPQRSAPQSSQIAITLADPVEIVRK
ncbi:YhgE/Pip domain-containing protein [Nocardia sp. NPDC050406]|uniref:YhgE/Pip domain-containing protein n=1 Tax=Nocardia sp. NPDC050406 TaxID=3364318 RepID=UPI00378784F2